MQDHMIGELRHQYMRAIQERQDKIDRMTEDQKVHKMRLEQDTITEIEDHFLKLVKEAKDMRNKEDAMPIP